MTQEISDVEVSHVITSTSEHANDIIMEIDDAFNATATLNNKSIETLFCKPKSGRWWKPIRKERYSLSRYLCDVHFTFLQFVDGIGQE